MERYTASPTKTLEEARTQILVHHLKGSRGNRFSAFTAEVVLHIFVVHVCARTCTCISMRKCLCICKGALMRGQNSFFCHLHILRVHPIK